MAGADMSFGPSGMIEAVSLLDMRRILFDREIFQSIEIITDGIEVNDNTLAFDMVRKAGPRGMFINQMPEENHQPEPLPEDVRQELRKLVAAADQDESLKREIKGH